MKHNRIKSTEIIEIVHLTELKANSVIHQEFFRLDDNNQRKTVINVPFIHILMIGDGKRIPDCCYGGWWTKEKPTFLGPDGRILGELVNLLSIQLNAQSLFVTPKMVNFQIKHL